MLKMNLDLISFISSHILQLSSIAVFGLSMVMLLHVALSRGRTVGRQDILRTMVLIFVAAVLFDWSSGERSLLSFLVSFFHAIQMATGNYDYGPVGSGDALTFWNDLYGLVLVIAAPTSTIALVVTYMTDLLSAPYIGFWSRFRDAFVFDQLDKRSLRLAESIVDYYEKHELQGVEPDTEPDRRTRHPFIVFTDVDNDAEEELASAARSMGAFCTSYEMGDVVGWCSNRRFTLSRSTFVTMLVTSADEGQNISLAKRLDRRANDLLNHSKSYFRIFVLTSLRSSETLLFDEKLFRKPDTGEVRDKRCVVFHRKAEDEHGNRVIIRGFDNTRGVIEHVIDRYPVFLPFNPRSPWLEVPKAAGNGKGGVVGQQYEGEKLWRILVERLLGRSDSRIIDRHIVVVGAGALGLEFVGSAIWASRIDGVHTRIDVIDCKEDPAVRGKTMAEEHFAANSPEVMSRVRADKYRDPAEDLRWYDLHFHLLDAEGGAYQSFLEKHAATITYVFVALGDDMRNAKVAMRTRQTLERELLRRLGRSKLSDDAYRSAARPLLVTFIENDDLANIVEKAHYEGQPCDIICIGRIAESFTYERLVGLKGSEKPEYNRRSSQASKSHAKYRLFAYLRHLWLAEPDVRLREGEQPSRDEILRMAGEVDWTQELDASWGAVRSYNRYCISQAVIDKYNDEAEREKKHPRTEVESQSHALRKEDPGDGKPCREWLLRMEHERWNAYMRVEGFELASTDETAALFDTGQEAHGKNLHRSNIAGLHPCLVGFDQLGDVYVSVDELYESHGVPENTGNRKTDQRPDDFSLQDDNYLIIGEKEAFFAQEASDVSA